MMISSGHAGWLIWVLWFLIGVFMAFVAQRMLGGKRVFFFDLVLGCVAAVLGGWIGTLFFGTGPVQTFLISLLTAIFAAGIILWLAGALMLHFSK